MIEKNNLTGVNHIKRYKVFSFWEYLLLFFFFCLSIYLFYLSQKNLTYKAFQLLKNKKSTEAQTYLKQAVEKEPTQLFNYLNLALSYDINKKQNKTEEIYKEAVSRFSPTDRNSFFLYFNKGEFHSRFESNPDQALQAYQKALTSNYKTDLVKKNIEWLFQNQKSSEKNSSDKNEEQSKENDKKKDRAENEENQKEGNQETQEDYRGKNQKEGQGEGNQEKKNRNKNQANQENNKKKGEEDNNNDERGQTDQENDKKKGDKNKEESDKNRKEEKNNDDEESQTTQDTKSDLREENKDKEKNQGESGEKEQLSKTNQSKSFNFDRNRELNEKAILEEVEKQESQVRSRFYKGRERFEDKTDKNW